MDLASLEGGFANPAIEAAQSFRAALRAMSRPGTVQQAGGVAPPAPLSVAAGALLLTLCDHETPVWLAPSLDTELVRDWVRFHTSAPLSGRADAQFAFGRWDEMLPLGDFAIGTPEYPDRSATLIIETKLGTQHELTGPGIRDTERLSVPDVDAFQMNAALFPLGLDFFLTQGTRLAALPRTTRIKG